MWSMTLLDKLRQPLKIKEMGTYMILEKGQWSIFTWRGGWGTFVTKGFFLYFFKAFLKVNWEWIEIALIEQKKGREVEYKE